MSSIKVQGKAYLYFLPKDMRKGFDGDWFSTWGSYAHGIPYHSIQHKQELLPGKFK